MAARYNYRLILKYEDKTSHNGYDILFLIFQ